MSKKFIFSIILFLGGTLGAGLFSVANSLERTTPNPSVICGILVFVFLGIAIAGLIILISDVANQKTNK